MFKGTDITKTLLRTLTEADTAPLTLKCLIQFSQDNFFLREMCELNTGLKIYELLKENVKQDLKNETVQGEEQNSSAKLNQAEDVFELVKEIKINP